MFKTSFLTPRNFIVIGLMTVVAHIAARPLYNIIDKKGSDNNG